MHMQIGWRAIRHHHQLQALLKPHQTRAKHSLERMQDGVQNLHTNLSGEEQEPCSRLSVAPPRSSANTSRVPQSAAEGLFVPKMRSGEIRRRI
nr:hypothetical protein Itr_chr01CG17910 [Ipomoea trifida]